MNKEEIIQILSTSKQYLNERFGLSGIALFGSFARNEQTSESDIDLLVDFVSPSYRNLCHTLYYLEPIFKGYKVQIVTRNAIKDRYFDAIKKDLIYV